MQHNIAIRSNALLCYLVKNSHLIIGRWKDKAEKQAYEKFMGILKDLRDILEYLGIWCTYKAAVAFKEKNGKY